MLTIHHAYYMNLNGPQHFSFTHAEMHGVYAIYLWLGFPHFIITPWHQPL